MGSGEVGIHALQGAVAWLIGQGFFQSSLEASPFHSAAILLSAISKECEEPSKMELATRVELPPGATFPGIITDRPAFYVARVSRRQPLERAYHALFDTLREVAQARSVSPAALAAVQCVVHLLWALLVSPTRGAGAAYDSLDAPRRAATARHARNRDAWAPYIIEADRAMPTAKTILSIHEASNRLAKADGVDLPEVATRTVAKWRRELCPKKP